MEVIDELEPTRRSVYTGALGWIDAGGDADLAMAIRTVLLDGDRASFQAGGAVTAESDPAAEHDETIAKARALARALGAELDGEPDDAPAAAPAAGGAA
jgi:para-aminobenzoate synthetase component 1